MIVVFLEKSSTNVIKYLLPLMDLMGIGPQRFEYINSHTSLLCLLLILLQGPFVDFPIRQALQLYFSVFALSNPYLIVLIQLLDGAVIHVAGSTVLSLELVTRFA